MVSFLIQLLVQLWSDRLRYPSRPPPWIHSPIRSNRFDPGPVLGFQVFQASIRGSLVLTLTRQTFNFYFSYRGIRNWKQMNIIFIIEAASSPSEIFKKRFKKEKRSESSIWEVQLSLFSRYFQHLPSFHPHYTQISPHQPQLTLFSTLFQAPSHYSFSVSENETVKLGQSFSMKMRKRHSMPNLNLGPTPNHKSKMKPSETFDSKKNLRHRFLQDWWKLSREVGQRDK